MSARQTISRSQVDRLKPGLQISANAKPIIVTFHSLPPADRAKSAKISLAEVLHEIGELRSEMRGLMQLNADLAQEMRGFRKQERCFYSTEVGALIEREVSRKHAGDTTLKAVSAVYHVSLNAMRGRSMEAEIVNARHAAMAGLREFNGLNSSAIGRILNKTQGAVSDALVHWTGRCWNHKECQRRYQVVRKILGGEEGSTSTKGQHDITNGSQNKTTARPSETNASAFAAAGRASSPSFPTCSTPLPSPKTPAGPPATPPGR